MSFAGDEKLIDAHKTQHKLPIHKGLVAPNKIGPPLAEQFEISQKDLFSTVTDELRANVTVFVIAVQLHDENAHWLELVMVAGEEVYM